jgi:hypothetical protein
MKGKKHGPEQIIKKLHEATAQLLGHPSASRRRRSSRESCSTSIAIALPRASQIAYFGAIGLPKT